MWIPKGLMRWGSMRPGLMGWALFLSAGLHGLALVAFSVPGEQEASLLTPAPEQPAEMQVLLSDPRRGVREGTDGEPAPQAEAEAAQSSPPTSPETSPESSPQSPSGPPDNQTAETPNPMEPAVAETVPEAAPAEPIPPDPAAEAMPVPPPPPPPPAPPQAPPGPAMSPPAAPSRSARVQLRERAGASPTGRDDGLTDIITGNNVVPPGGDPALINIPPRYPLEAARRGQQGRVVLNVLVATDGGVISVEVAESSGYPILDRAARDAVAKWHFRPGTRDGLTVPSTIPVPLAFILEN